jgi:hypothetical protein
LLNEKRKTKEKKVKERKTGQATGHTMATSRRRPGALYSTWVQGNNSRLEHTIVKLVLRQRSVVHISEESTPMSI